MKKYLLLLIYLLLITACNNRQSNNTLPTLTVTIEPLRYFTEAIAGNRFKVVSMVPEGTSPETYDPTPQQLVDLTKSAAYLQIGYIGFEQSWIEKLKSNNPQLAFFDMSQGVALIHEDEKIHHDHVHAGGVEPHIWNSTKNAAIIADNICYALCELDRNHADEYRQRTDSLKQIINQTDKEIRALLLTTTPSFLIYHPALSYFARDYGLTQISIEENGKEPSPSQLQQLIKQCQNKHIRVIFVQKEFDVRNAQLIAQELGVKVVSIHPLSYYWKEEMIKVAQTLATNPTK